MLACARIGAPHSVVFGGFSPDSLIDRINDAECKVVITADGGYRRGLPSMLKPNVDVALGSTPSVEHVVVVTRVDEAVEMVDGRDRKSVVSGKSVSVRVDLGGRRIIKKNKINKTQNEYKNK